MIHKEHMAKEGMPKHQVNHLQFQVGMAKALTSNWTRRKTLIFLFQPMTPLHQDYRGFAFNVEQDNVNGLVSNVVGRTYAIHIVS